jgi:hypothetical protein
VRKFIAINADSAANARCFILTADHQLALVALHWLPIMASALFAFPRRSLRVFHQSTEDKNVLHSVSTRLAGRAWTPLGKSHINSMTRAIAFLLNKHISQKVKKEAARDYAIKVAITGKLYTESFLCPPSQISLLALNLPISLRFEVDRNFRAPYKYPVNALFLYCFMRRPFPTVEATILSRPAALRSKQ